MMEITKDAKLSTKKRNRLPKSTFCGPGRSFPVPDCAHVVAARRLLGRAKFSESTKAKIRSCINRRAKQLGCSSKSKDQDESQFEQQVKDIIDGDYGRQIEDLLEWIEEIDESNYKAQERLAMLVSKTGVVSVDSEKLKERNIDYLLDMLEEYLSNIEGQKSD